ncbi:hypothetical protein C8F04DRAFT_1174848 [Mycena alexandri]|uniref:Uncharacterized protein n=1 Tax=Mycena alexandri TaxID=1745969 RepID=A0AAD6THM3_9AGAR|nr:hypothetical protein C8F04DRAFT_1174848 [Mycena alexandri]
MKVKTLSIEMRIFHLPVIFINEAIAGDPNHNIAHPAIDVADHQFPFKSELAADIFGRALADAPLQLGVLPAEWEANGYPESETVKPNFIIDAHLQLTSQLELGQHDSRPQTEENIATSHLMIACRIAPARPEEREKQSFFLLPILRRGLARAICLGLSQSAPSAFAPDIAGYMT